MKIGYFGTYPYRINGDLNIALSGGVGNVNYNLAREMAKRGHEVYVFTCSMEPRDSVEKEGNLTVYRYRKDFKIGGAPMSLGVLYKPLKLDIDLDIVHAHIGNMPAPITGYLYSKKRKKPFIITHHNEWIGGYGDFTRRIGVWFYNTFIADRLYSKADKIVALSKNQIVNSRLLKKCSHKTIIIPNGIYINQFKVDLKKEDCKSKLGIPINKKVILFVGSLTPRKGPHILIDAMRKIVSLVPEAYLVFIGDGTMKQKLENTSLSLGLADNIRFVGLVNDQNIKSLYYKSADIFVLPSLPGEGFPITLLEASASGLPLVVSDLEIFSAFVQDRESGIITKMGDSQDLANKIIELLNNDVLRNYLANKSLEKSRNFDWSNIAITTEDLYFKLKNSSN